MRIKATGVGVASEPGRAFWRLCPEKEFGDHQIVEGSVVLKKGSELSVHCPSGNFYSFCWAVLFLGRHL